MLVDIRTAEPNDVPAMAAIRAQEWETESYWVDRIAGYLSGTHSPQHALAERIAFVAVDDATVVGFVAAHRTSRFGCAAELQWINVSREHRGKRIATQLMGRIAE